jgi:ribosomal protein S18 acetylase RimI-like enzyme
MAWTIRTGRRSDIPAVLALWRDAGAEPTHTDDAGSLGQLISRDPSALIVAEEAGHLVGTVIAGWDGWRGSIYRLAVVPTSRRQGLGRQLLDRAERRLELAGAVRLQAVVVETETVAVGFWQSIGWERQAHRLRFVRG